MVQRSFHSYFTRRQFMRQAGLASAGLFLADRLLADPYRPVRWMLDDAVPILIRGRVTVEGRGLGGVAVSDGMSVVATAQDGTYALHSNSRQEFVHLSLPSGTEIPTNPTGTARFYAPLAPNDDGSMDVVWNLKASGQRDDRHAFLVLADPQTLDMEDMRRFHSETVPDIRSVASSAGMPMFGVGCGDLMFDRLALFPEYEKAVGMSGAPPGAPPAPP